MSRYRIVSRGFSVGDPYWLVQERFGIFWLTISHKFFSRELAERLLKALELAEVNTP